jgi:hypothetical protein
VRSFFREGGKFRGPLLDVDRPTPDYQAWDENNNMCGRALD